MAKAIDLQEHGLILKIFGEFDDPYMRHINPSIAWYNDQLIIAIRECNFAVKRHGDWYFRDGSAYSKTNVLIGNVYIPTLSPFGVHEPAILDNAPTMVQVSGLEDVRLFSRDGVLCLIGFQSDRLTRSLHNESTSMGIYCINEDGDIRYIDTLKKPNKDTVEKNWSPPDVKSDKFDYTYSPTQVIKDDKLIGKPYKGEIHGGSQLIKQKDGTYLSLVHKKTADPMLGRVYDRFVYHTYLARHDENGFITEITPPFTFGTHENIEFASGMVEYDGDFIISLGIRDCKIALGRIRKSKLVDMLKPYNGE